MTRLNLSSRDPGSWSAAVSRNFSVLEAEGSIVSAGLFSDRIILKDPGGSFTVGSVRAGGLLGNRAGCSWPLDIVGLETGVVGVTLDVPKEEDTREGATVVGEKKVPSSSVSRKSL
jgi:hypothetical protein